MTGKCDELSKDERELLRECVCAAAEGPFFPDWEIHTLLGAYREQLQRICEQWPTSMEDPNSRSVAKNVLVNLAGYPIDEPNRWGEFISADLEDVRALKLRLIAIDW